MPEKSTVGSPGASAVAVPLPHADHGRAVRGDATVCEAEAVGPPGPGRQRPWFHARAVDAVQARVVEARAERLLTLHPRGAAAVLVHPRADVEARGADVARVSAVELLDEHPAPSLVGAILEPP